MEQKQGLKNMAINIEKSMVKITKREKLTQTELDSIAQFYLEVVNYLSKD